MSHSSREYNMEDLVRMAKELVKGLDHINLNSGLKLQEFKPYTPNPDEMDPNRPVTKGWIKCFSCPVHVPLPGYTIQTGHMDTATAVSRNTTETTHRLLVVFERGPG